MAQYIDIAQLLLSINCCSDVMAWALMDWQLRGHGVNVGHGPFRWRVTTLGKMFRRMTYGWKGNGRACVDWPWQPTGLSTCIRAI